MKTAVVFVHGLFLNGAEFTLLRRRLSASHGFQSHRFSYPTVSGSINSALSQLNQFVSRIDAERIHFVGHSLGGLVLSRYFERERFERPGRVVLLGSPVVGSSSARAIARHAWLKRVLGPLVAEELLDPSASRCWACERELGLIAGTTPMGLGRFFARFDEDCDGTVAVSETKLPGHTAHLTMPVSHMGMLASADVARQVGEFLDQGRFSVAAAVSAR
jgi:pimeloyl-ACP methyl ester carboxylesterase